jgi:hypothetical protein
LKVRGNFAQQAQHENERVDTSISHIYVAISMDYVWLGNLDSNQDKQSQSLLCYRYTIPQWIVEQVQ